MEGGDRQLTSWLKEEGFQTSLRTINQVGAPSPCSDIAEHQHSNGAVKLRRGSPKAQMMDGVSGCPILRSTVCCLDRFPQCKPLEGPQRSLI